MNIIGDVNDCDCIIVDDMIDIGGILVKVVEVLKSYGVCNVYVYVIYVIFFGNVVNNFKEFVIDEIIVIDFILLVVDMQKIGKVKQFILFEMLVEIICCISNEEFILVMFEY